MKFLFLISVVLWAGVVSAQSRCGDRADILKSLNKLAPYEIIKGRGLSRDGAIFEFLFDEESGTWSIIKTRIVGDYSMTCLVEAGEYWEEVWPERDLKL